MGESQAILTYLAKTLGWQDVYPDDPKRQALIDVYFNYHHTNTRQVTIGLFVPVARSDLKWPEARLAEAKKVVKNVLKHFEEIFLAKSTFIFSDTPSIADISAYQELGQCQEKYCNLIDFSPYPRIQQWLASMEQLRGHKESHEKAERMFKVVKKNASA